MREVECQLSKLIINEQQDAQVLWLQEKNGSRAFAVIVGFFEASSLRDRIRGFTPPRPMTHHLIANCIRDLGGVLRRIVVTELKENTYYARLVVEKNGETVRVDARPSDSLVLAVQEGVPIYVNEDVLAEASKWSSQPQVDFSVEDLEASFDEAFGEGFDEEDEEEEEDQDDYDEDDEDLDEEEDDQD